MDRAEPRRTPISPNPRRDWLTAILAGLTIAFGLAFGIEYLDDTVKTPEDVTRRLKLPLLGLVPAVRGHRVPILTEKVPHDFGEAFRCLRASLVYTSGVQPGARAGARRLTRLAHRRRHASARAAQDDGAAERYGALAPARRAVARA